MGTERFSLTHTPIFLCIAKAVGAPTVEPTALLIRNGLYVIDRLRTKVKIPNFAILLQERLVLINWGALSCLILATAAP